MEEQPSSADRWVAEVGEIEVTGLRPPRSPRAWAPRIALVALALALGLAVPLGGFAALRERAVALLRPTPTLAPALPGANSFYFLPAPTWVFVWVDGQRLGDVPLAGTAAPPLRLPPGTHHIEWLGSPFNQPRCALVVPIPFIYRPGTNACAIQPYLGRPAGYVLQYRESLATLSSQQQDALRTAIQGGLNAEPASAAMRAGQPYLVPVPQTVAPSGFRLATAPAALRATLSFTLDPNPPWSEPCAESGETLQPCRFADQDCRLLCTLPDTSFGGIGWLVAVPARASWTLTTLDGVPAGTAADGPHQADVLVVMRLSWDFSGWHAPPLFGHAAGGAVADDTVCAPARDWLASGAALLGLAPGPLVPGGTLTGADGSVTYASGGDPTDGCAVTVQPGALAFAPSPAVTQPMQFLLRFGVLLAVNDAAHQVVPGLPVADSAEQAIAQRLLSALADATTRTISDLDADGRY
ncbi:MAG TPA: hypothetical protein VGR57_02060 [Ktedonobacterales bacterium]|nr:hypothetical protein [Ktedonobacterales bacterium]